MGVYTTTDVLVAQKLSWEIW